MKLFEILQRPWARALPWAAGITVALGLLMAFFYAPPDAVQGEVQRILYLHVPSAWTGYLAFFLVFTASILFLWRKAAAWDIVARSAAQLGVLFIGLALVTGAIWGKPTWGTWWTWDARLTTTFILFTIYVGYLMLRAFTPDSIRAAKAAAVLGILGFLDVPLIHISVLWWRTLHQAPTVFRIESPPTMAGSMLLTLSLNVVAFTLLFVYLMIQRTATEAYREEIVRLTRED